MGDYIVRATAAGGQVRAFAATTKGLVEEAKERHNMSPIATVALGKSGAINAAYLAMQILAITDKELAVKLKEDRIVKAKAVETDSKDIEVLL